jgi:hypothetical protein
MEAEMQIQILLSEADVQGFAPQVRDALLAEIQRRLAERNAPVEVMGAFAPSAPAGNGPGGSEEEQAADLSVQQARRFLEACNNKTTQVIRAIAAGKSREFRLSDLMKTLGMTFDDVGGVWGGLTRRVRTILGDKKTKAKLVVWPENFYDENNEWTDSTGAISEVTYLSFREVFGIR